MSETSANDRSPSGIVQPPGDIDGAARWTPANIALAAAERRKAYARLAIIGCVILVLVALYFNTFAQMARVWVNSVTFRHGLVIFPIVAWLIWVRRHALAAASLKPAWWALPGLLVLALGWVLGWLADVNVAQQLAVIAMLPVLVTTIMGVGVFRALRFPLLYVFFAVPLGWFLVAPLMHATAFMAVTGLKLSGIPVFQDGFRISVPTGDFLVANACSGIRYLIACLALGTLFAYLFYRSWPRRLAFVAVALIVPVIANGIRAYGIILMAYLSNMRIATGFDHEIYGFVFFAVVLVIMFGIGSLFREDLTEPPLSRAAGQVSGGTGEKPAGAKHILGSLAVAVLVIGIGPALAYGLGQSAPATPYHPALPNKTGTWQGPAIPRDQWQPHFVGRHQQSAGEYVNNGRRVEVRVEAYAYPDHRTGVSNFRNRVANGPGALIDSGRHNPHVKGEPDAVIQSIVRDGTTTRLVWSWYRVDGRGMAGRVPEKFREVLHVLRGGHGWAQWVSVSTPMPADLAAAQNTLRDFLSTAGQPLARCLLGRDQGQCAH